LKEAREAAGLTQVQLSQKLLVDPMTVSRWELDKSTPNRWLMRSIIEALPKLSKLPSNDHARAAG
jgi:DNA-binding XRE family transcriptional regulator